jgi:hypothetical protein
MATTTKQHFEQTAAIIREAYRTPAGPETKFAIAALADDFASAYSRDNSRFDRSRFLRACGVESDLS